MSHNPRDCESCRSCAPCPDHEAAKREPRVTVSVRGQAWSLTETELWSLYDRVAMALEGVLHARGAAAVAPGVAEAQTGTDGPADLATPPRPGSGPALAVDSAELPGENEAAIAKGHYLHTVSALVLGFNELAKLAPILGEKAYFRLARDRAIEELEALGHHINVTTPTIVLTLGQRPPYVEFLETDIEAMRACVAEWDARTPGVKSAGTGITLAGFTCTCGAFNGDEKVARATCRACGGPRP